MLTHPRVAGLCALMLLAGRAPAAAQELDFTAIRAEADFSQKLRDWDGFGFNYVEVSQTLDYAQDSQEYGGFSLLKEAERQEIVDMVFGPEGLRPGLVKMFLDPFHQKEPGGAFDHETTTRWMRYFVREGLKRNPNLRVITTLYGPPPWATRQKYLRGFSCSGLSESAS